MSINTTIRQATHAETAAEMDRRGAVIERLEARISELARERDEARQIAEAVIAERQRDLAAAEARGVLRGREEIKREVYALHEDTIENYHGVAEADQEGKQGAFARGRMVEAKSIARAIGNVCALPPPEAAAETAQREGG